MRIKSNISLEEMKALAEYYRKESQRLKMEGYMYNSETLFKQSFACQQKQWEIVEDITRRIIWENL